MNDRLLGMLGLCVRARKACLGTFLTEKAIDEGSAKLVVMAEDIGESNKRKIEGKCRAENIKIVFYSTKEKLGHATGKKNIPVMCICDEGFSSSIIKLAENISCNSL